MKARVAFQSRPRMNKTEKRFAQEWLEPSYHELWRFESIKLRLADRTWYTPDFVVYTPNVEFYEVKGFWRDDARVKIKVAAEQYPEFQFFGVSLVKGRWEVEEFK